MATGCREHGLALPIAEAVAAANGCTLEDLEPLQRTVDVDGLEGFVDSCGDDGMVVFTYESCRVTVTGDGSIDVQPTSGTDGTGASEPA